MCTTRNLNNARNEAAFEHIGLGIVRVMILDPVDQFLAGNIGLRGRLGEPGVVIAIGPEQLDIAAPVAAIDVDDGRVELQRGHGDQDLAIKIGGLHGLEPTQLGKIGAKPNPGGQER